MIQIVWGRSETVPIVAGRLSGIRILRERALRYPSIIVGRYELEFADAFGEHCRKARVVYDIGANCGYFSLIAAKANKDAMVHCFEPMPELDNEIGQVLAANHLTQRVHKHPTALSDQIGHVRMVTPGDDPTSLMETALQGQQVEDNGVSVPMTTLDAFVESQGLDLPEVVKIDVEGAESFVLNGGINTLLNSQATIFIEVHGRRQAGLVWEWAKTNSYSVCDISETPISTVDEWNTLFPRKWSVVHALLTVSKPES